ncbi:hypothetical protein NKI12_19360 [Mesorhizobium australicum]|uniref:Uncharacterized protein n=1 Tax=Mesorhizobium australicum TaxID=536018 RepID=A0ACC6SZB3_9HYPH
MKTERFEMRVTPEFLKLVDDWRRQQPTIPARADAIRQIVERALSSDEGPGLRDLLRAWFTANPHRISEFGLEDGDTPEQAARSIMDDSADQSPVNGANVLIRLFDDEPDQTAKHIVALLQRITR